MSAPHDAERTPILVEVERDLAELIPGFLANRANDVVSVRALVSRDDLQSVCRIGHSMKGSGGGYGFDTITRLGGEMEQAARAGDGTKVLVLADELEDFLARVRPVFS